MTQDERDIAPTRGLGLIIFFVAGWLALLAYGSTVKHTYDGLEQAYRNGKALVAARDRLVPIRPEGSGPMTKPELVEVLKRLVPGAAQEISSVDRLGAFEEVVNILFKDGRTDKPSSDGTAKNEGKNGRPDQPTLLQLIALVCEPKAAKGACNPSGGQVARNTLDAAVSNELAQALAAAPLRSDIPGGFPDWLKSVLGIKKEAGFADAAQEFMSRDPSELQRPHLRQNDHETSWREYVLLSSPARPRDSAILAALGRQLKVKPLNCIEESCESDKEQASYNAALKTTLALLSALHQTEEVDKAWNRLRLIVGSEQLAIIFLAVLLLLTLIHLQAEYAVEADIWERLHSHLNKAAHSRESWAEVLEDTSDYFERSTRILETPYSIVLTAWCHIASPMTDPGTPRTILMAFLLGISAVGMYVLGIAGWIWLWLGLAAAAVSSVVNYLRTASELNPAWSATKQGDLHDIGRAARALLSSAKQIFSEGESSAWWTKAKDLAKRLPKIGRAEVRLKPVLPRARVREHIRQTSVADRIFRGHVRDVFGADQDEHRTAESESAVDQARGSLALRRSFLQWGIAALPALGFIGTVHGIMDALSEADQLTRPGATQVELAAAMSDITARLSLAFSTTLMALLAGLTLGFWVHLLTSRHEQMLGVIQSYFPARRAQHERHHDKPEERAPGLEASFAYSPVSGPAAS